MSEKSEITKAFKQIEKKGLGLVFTANSKKSIPTGFIGFPDHLIVTWQYIVWVEVKLPGDSLSERQKAVQKILLHHTGLKSSRNEYRIVTSLKQAQELTDKIIQGRI